MNIKLLSHWVNLMIADFGMRNADRGINLSSLFLFNFQSFTKYFPDLLH